MKIGYLIPGFPSQTHIFFWREKCALEKLGVEVEFASTRRPDARLVTHSWAADAMARTVYLHPPRPGAALGTLLELLRAGPGGWGRCAAAVARAEGYSALGRFRLLALMFLGGQLAHTARRKGWSHVHVHSCADCANIGLFASLLSGLTYSLTLHGPLKDYGPNQRQKWRHASFALVITTRLLADVREELSGHLPDFVDVAPMGVDLRVFQRQSPYRPWQGSGPCLIFSCGRLTPVKGHKELVRAIAFLRDRGVDAQLRIAGEDASSGQEYRRSLEQMIGNLSLGHSVTLLGAVPEEAVRSELEQAQVFALASWAEPLGVATMEAMAMELPVVVTGRGGVPELVDDGVSGLLVDPKAPQQLADAILSVIRSPRLAQRLGEASRRKIEASFHSGISAQRIAGHLHALAGPLAQRRRSWFSQGASSR